MSRHAATLVLVLGLAAFAAGQEASTLTVDTDKDKDCKKKGNCPPSGTGDPIMTDFVGRTFEFFGKGGSVYNVYSDSAHQINMGLFDSYNNGHNGTYMDSYGISCGNSRVNVTLIGEGDLRVELKQDQDQESSVLVSGEPLEALVGDATCKLSVKMEAFNTPGGHTVEVKSDVMTMAIRTAPAGAIDSNGIPQPAYLNFELHMHKSPVGSKAAGIIGETAMDVNKLDDQLKSSTADGQDEPAKDTHKRHEDAFYAVTGLFGTDFAANAFTGATVSPVTTSRRSLMRSAAFAGVHFPLIAFSK